MSEHSFLSSDNSNQFDIFKLSGKGFSIEQINQIYELDEYFSIQGIGQKREFIKYLLENKDIVYSNDLVSNIEVVLKYQNNPVFNRVAERLRCATVEHYYRFILSGRNIESFCDTYTSVKYNKKSLDYPRDENGIIILEPKDYLIANIQSGGTREGRWHLLSNRTRVFIKNVCNPEEAYGELVAQQIARQMGIPYTEYDLVTLGGLTKIASINILETGEELLHGNDILPVKSNKDIGYICRSIERALKSRYPNICAEKLQEIKEDFLKIVIFDKIIFNWDRNPGNWGLILSPDGSVRMAPEFDNNKALDLDKFDPRKDMHIEGDRSINTILEFCLDNFEDKDKFLEFIHKCTQNVSARKACETIKEEKGIIIPEKRIKEMEYMTNTRGVDLMKSWLTSKGYPRQPILEEELCL